MGCECGHDLAVAPDQAESSPKIEVEFAKFSKALLVGAPVALTTEQLVHVYKMRVMQLGFKCGDQKMSRKGLFAEIEIFFGTDLLARVDPSYSKSKTSGWFHVLQASLAIEAPLYRHLLFAFYLFREPAAFLSSIHDVSKIALLTADGRQADAGPLAEKSATDALMDELIEVARRNGYDSQKLWHNCVGSMKRLVRYLPDACKQIDARLNEEANKKKRDAARALKATASDRKLDPLWTDAIVSAAAAIYSKEERPYRVTMNRLLKKAAFRPKGTLCPTQERTPLARAAAEGNAESTWHFYARRMLWTLQSLDDHVTAEHTIVKLSQLEVFKAREILKFFESVRRCGGASVKEITQILASRGVDRHWIGPCPEKAFYRAGRAYELRTPRAGLSAGRTGMLNRSVK